MALLKSGVNPKDIELFKSYLQRIEKEYDLILSRMKLYFAICSGNLAVMGYLLTQSISNDSKLHLSSPYIWLVIAIFAVIGQFVSLIWRAVIADGRDWQLRMNKILENCERKLIASLPSREIKWRETKEITEDMCGMYTMINRFYDPGKPPGADTIDWHLVVPSAFAFIFSAIAILCIVAFILSLQT